MGSTHDLDLFIIHRVVAQIVFRFGLGTRTEVSRLQLLSWKTGPVRMGLAGIGRPLEMGILEDQVGKSR